VNDGFKVSLCCVFVESTNGKGKRVQGKDKAEDWDCKPGRIDGYGRPGQARSLNRENYGQNRDQSESGYSNRILRTHVSLL
jgi:hypothetical protein